MGGRADSDPIPSPRGVLEFARKDDPQPFHLSDEARRRLIRKAGGERLETSAMTMAMLARI